MGPAILSLQTTIFVRFYLKWNVEIESGKWKVECPLWASVVISIIFGILVLPVYLIYHLIMNA